MLWRPKHHRRIAQLADVLTTAVSFVVAYFVWNLIQSKTNIPVGNAIEYDWPDIGKLLGLCVVWVVIFNSQKAYTYQRFTSMGREIAVVFKTTILGVLVFFAAIFMFRFQYIPRTYVFLFAVISFGCLTVEKMLLFQVASIIRKRGRNRKRVLLVGTRNKAISFVKKVEDNIGWGLDVIGLLSAEETDKGDTVAGKKVLGVFSDVEEVLHNNVVDEVLICLLDENFLEARSVLETCEREGVQVRLNSDFFGNLAKKISVDYVYGLSVVSFFTSPNNEWTLYLKRIMDIFISGFFLVLLSPLFFIIAIAIKLGSKGPVFYEWNVVGLNKKPFKSWKFRTMVQNAEELKEKLESNNEMNGPVFKIKNDPRVTRVGKFFRKFSLDELPQLLSVLNGDMSLVGPRPAGPDELKRYDSWHRRKLSVKAGITCLWQVKGRNKIVDFDEWAKLDLEYIDNWSIWLDIKILLMTIPVVIMGRGAS